MVEINSSGGKAVGIGTDVTDEGSVRGAFERIEELRRSEEGFGGKDEEGGLAAAIFNVGGGFLRKPFLELKTEEFEGGWKTNG